MIFGKSNNELVIGIHMGTGELLRVLFACVFYSSWYMIHSRRSLRSARCHIALLYMIGL